METMKETVERCQSEKVTVTALSEVEERELTPLEQQMAVNRLELEQALATLTTAAQIAKRRIRATGKHAAALAQVEGFRHACQVIRRLPWTYPKSTEEAVEIIRRQLRIEIPRA